MKIISLIEDYCAVGVALSVFLMLLWDFLPEIPFLGISLLGLIKIFLILAVSFLLLTGKKKINLLVKNHLLISGFFILSSISLISSSNLGNSFYSLKAFLSIFIFYFVFVISIDKERYIKWVAIALVASALIHSIIILTSCYSGSGLVFRAGGLTARPEPFSDINWIAISIVSSIPLLFFTFKKSNEKRKKIFYFILFLLVFLAVMLTFSRSAILILIISLLFILFILFFKCIGNKIRMPKLYIYFVLVLLVFIPLFIFSNLSDSGNVLSGHCKRNHFFIYYDRVHLLDSGLESVSQDYIVGVGISDFKVETVYTAEDGPIEKPIHNSYLSTLGELGIFGFLVFILLSLSSLHLLYKSKNVFAKSFFIFFFSILLIGFFHDIDNMLVFWIFIMIASALENIRLKNKIL